MQKYYLSIGAIFKNEEIVIKEWLEHYLYHGVQHFYLINDYSTDNFIKILKPYIQNGLITLFDNDIEQIRGRQSLSYNKFFKSILQETKWLAILDIDEYLYSPLEIDLKKILINYENYSQIIVNWVWFGSNGLIKQPKSIVESFIKRAPINYKTVSLTPDNGYQLNDTCGNKGILNTDFNILNIGIHGHSSSNDKIINLSWKSSLENPILLNNHYALMSQEYWREIKMKRGDVNCWFKTLDRDMDYFETWDINHVEDKRLYEQNKILFNK
jgi:hypothetical protein